MPAGTHDTWSVTGQQLAGLLRETRDPFLLVLESRQLSERYVERSRFIIDEFADFSQDAQPTDPWQFRRAYLDHRAALRGKYQFSTSYLVNHGRQLRYFLRWYRRQVADGRVHLGELSKSSLRAYWTTQPRALPYRHKMLHRHLEPLLAFIRRQPELLSSSELEPLLQAYFKMRHFGMRGRGDGNGISLNSCAINVTRRHLLWLEEQGSLPDGAVTSSMKSRDAGWARDGQDGLLLQLTAKMGTGLSEGLRQPLLDYIEHLIHDRQLARETIQEAFRAGWTLCRHLAEEELVSFAQLRVTHIDHVVSSLVSAPRKNLLRRRQQVRKHQSKLRGFVSYLHQRAVLDRDLASLLVSPPCYRASTPPTVLTEAQVRTLLESASRDHAKGRRCLAVLLLMTTYGLRPVDVSRLRLDHLHWRERRIGLVQGKTGNVVTLPLLVEVAAALYAYLRYDRRSGLPHRQVFVSLKQPHRPLSSEGVSCVVADALRQAGLQSVHPRHLRATVATHLLRHDEGISTIQEVLGHRTIETTQRYAVTDIELLRQVLEEPER